MFQGRDYALYETLMQPYATRLARDLPPRSIGPDWVPYCPSGVELDPVRQTACDLDPVWPHRRFLSSLEWEILQRVDGAATADQITAAVAAGSTADREAVWDALWLLQVEGLLLFQRGQ